MDTDCDDLDEIDFDINIDDTDIFGELDRPEGPSLVVDDHTVFNFSGEIELIELPEIESSIEIEVEKKEVLCSRKVIKCSKCKKNFAAERFFKFHVQSCTNFETDLCSEFLQQSKGTFLNVLLNATTDPFFNMVPPGTYASEIARKILTHKEDEMVEVYAKQLNRGMANIFEENDKSSSAIGIMLNKYHIASVSPEVNTSFINFLTKLGIVNISEYGIGSSLLFQFILRNSFKQLLILYDKQSQGFFRFNKAEIDINGGEDIALCCWLYTL